MLPTAETVRGKPTPSVLRWLALIDQHGGQAAALHVLIKHSDELARLKRAVRAYGLSPEILGSEMHAADLDRSSDAESP